MRELLPFWRCLRRHPGVPVALLLQIIGGLAALVGPSGNWIAGAGALSFFWLPVLLTAWLDRNHRAK